MVTLGPESDTLNNESPHDPYSSDATESEYIPSSALGSVQSSDSSNTPNRACVSLNIIIITTTA